MRLQKLHGLGNDFLVLLDDGDAGPAPEPLVVALCDRSTGLGADGLVRCTRTLDGASFRLRNADGSPAEISGNGARCVGLAAARAGWWADLEQPFVLTTPVGPRVLEWQGGDLVVAALRVGMGSVGGLAGVDDLLEVGGWSRQAVDTGNPHLVALVHEPALPSRAWLQEAVDAVEALRPNGFNHEFVARGPGAGDVTMAVKERGAGWTQACGSGSVAAAYAAHVAGWVDRRATVRNPGGDVVVDLVGEEGGALEALLTGPAAFVADVEVPDEVVAAVLGVSA
jgi:diaminopimelate epimerase